jgi:hypothetical protein
VTIERAFAITFSVAIVLEALQWLVTIPALSPFAFWAGYLLLVALGFMLGRKSHPYRTAFANTWPFVLLWLVVGWVGIGAGRGYHPPGWTDETTRLAQWGWLIGNILYLPVAFAAPAFGVWLARMFSRRGKNASSAA